MHTGFLCAELWLLAIAILAAVNVKADLSNAAGGQNERSVASVGHAPSVSQLAPSQSWGNAQSLRNIAAFHVGATFPRAREGGASASGVSIRRRRRAAMGTVRREPIETPLASGTASCFLSRISGWRDRRLYPLAGGSRGGAANPVRAVAGAGAVIFYDWVGAGRGV